MSPTFAQVNLVVRDLATTVAFYRALGLDVRQPVGRHAAAAVDGITIEFDEASFADVWNAGSPGAVGGGAVLSFSLPHRADVDALWHRMTHVGATTRQRPYDAFWGSRFAVIADPDGYQVGLMSPPEEAHRFWPPKQGPA